MSAQKVLNVAAYTRFKALNKGDSSIPLFEIHKSIEKKVNPGYKLKLRETHQI